MSNFDIGLGASYRYSDYKEGETITYRIDNETVSGEVLHVCAPGPVVAGGKSLPVHYLVERDDSGDTMPDVVFVGDIVAAASSN